MLHLCCSCCVFVRIRRAAVHQHVEGRKYIAWHVRATDNLVTLETDWDVPAKLTYKLERFLVISEHIKKQDSSVDTIYVATDNENILKKIDAWTQHGKPGFSKWNFVYNRKARRTAVKLEQEKKQGNTLKKTTTKTQATGRSSKGKNKMKSNNRGKGQAVDNWEWMFQGKVDAFSVLLDLVLFKQANYIVGSQTSNVFRLATALNHFHNKGDKKRAHEIDHHEWQPGADIRIHE